MALEQLHYRVVYAGTVYPDVHVKWADQLLGEREGPRHGITRDLPLHLTTYWCWAVLRRTAAGVPDDFQAFLNDPDLEIEPHEIAEETVNPTAPAAPNGSVLHSVSPSPAPLPTGGDLSPTS